MQIRHGSDLGGAVGYERYSAGKRIGYFGRDRMPYRIDIFFVKCLGVQKYI